MCYLPLAVLGVFRGPVTYVFASRSPVSPRGLAGALRLLQLLPDTSNDGWVSFFKVDIPLELHTCISSCLVDVLQVLRFIILEVRVSILRQEPKDSFRGSRQKGSGVGSENVENYFEY